MKLVMENPDNLHKYWELAECIQVKVVLQSSIAEDKRAKVLSEIEKALAAVEKKLAV